MFEFLDTFWGGAVSFASGSLAIYGAVQAFSNKPKRLLYDFRSWSPSKVRVPEEFETRYRLAGNDFGSIHITECIIKNETGAPITDTSFLHLPKILLGNNNSICRVRRLLGLEDSRANFRSKDDSSEIEIYDIMIPIESTLTIEIVSVEPIEKKNLLCSQRCQSRGKELWKAVAIPQSILDFFAHADCLRLANCNAVSVKRFYKSP
jgi:hypothetical protein